MENQLQTKTKITWCPGCSDFAILKAIREAILELNLPKENLVLVSGIGCHAKIVDYINLNSFYSIHGRVPATATGIKLGNPNLTVIGFAGDGDAYGEGLEHLIFAAKRNSDIKMIIHNNRVYALTVGQFAPTSPEGFKGPSTPLGSKEPPLNPLSLMMASNASFIARGFTGDLEGLKEIFKKALLHKGFSFVDVLQPCLSFYNLFNFYKERVYYLKDHDPRDKNQVLKKIGEWDYKNDGKIPLGVFYQEKRQIFEEKIYGDF